MRTLNRAALVDIVVQDCAVDARTARLAVNATLAALAASLDGPALRRLASAIGEREQGALLADAADVAGRAICDIDDVIAHVAARARLPLAAALEIALVVCGTIGAGWTDDDARAIGRSLSSSLSSLFEPRDAAPAVTAAGAAGDAAAAAGAHALAAGAHTLAAGAPGSRTPLSSSAPPAPDETGESSKLSSATPDHTLARGAPGDAR